ncbi:MAG: hypothetical protein A2V83_07120 [Nitrospirae bacterium RBG_16_64_22]|nr:MAG: hypothetical protein A2V83_07120 [Nitrospirae bacterium RBG_16_64_22]
MPQPEIVVVCIDPNTPIQKILDAAIDRTGPGAREIVLVSVTGGPGESVEMEELDHEALRNAARMDARLVLERAETHCRSRGVTPRLVVREGGPADEIVTLAAEVGASLVVVGSRGRKGVLKTLLGNVSAEVVERAPCSVLVVR